MPAPAWYVSGNVMEGREAMSNDNSLGTSKEGRAHLVDNEFSLAPIVTHSADLAYKLVLARAGATLPARDPVDTRIAKEATIGNTTYGKGVVLNPVNVGGWPELASTTAPVDTDNDGMPDSWETDNGLNPNDETDRNNLGPDGYTMLEKYLNSIVSDHTAILPSVSITSPSNNDEFEEHANITINADASDSDGSVAIVEFYQGTTSLGTDDSSPYSITWENVPEGNYSITAVATDDDGISSLSSVVDITVIDTSVSSIPIQEDRTSQEVIIYPVPVNNLLNIELGSEVAGDVVISLIDMTGKVMKSVRADGPVHTMDMSGLPGGSYNIKISSASLNKVVRIAKQ
jgi:hypothetical protein